MSPVKSESSQNQIYSPEASAVKFTPFSFDSEFPQNFSSTNVNDTKNDFKSDLRRQERLIREERKVDLSYSTTYFKEDTQQLAGKSMEPIELHLPLNNAEQEQCVKFSSGSDPPPDRGMTEQLKSVIFYLYGLVIFGIMIFAYVLSMCYRQLVKVLIFCLYGKKVRLISGPTDALWGYETDSSSSNIVLVFKCEGTPDMERIIEDFERKVIGFRTLLRADGNADGIYDMYAPYEKLGWIIKQKFMFFCWERDDEFSVRNHFFMEKVMDEGNNVDERIEAVCGAYLEYKLDHMKPQWEFRVIAPIPGGTCTEWGLVFCVHHAYGDGLSWLQMIRHCLADEHVRLPLEPLKSRPSTLKIGQNTKKSILTKFGQFMQLTVSVPHLFACEISQMLQEDNAFHGPSVKGEKTCCWTTESIPLKKIKDVKQKNGQPVLFTSVILACATKAFQKSFQNCNSKIPYKILSGVPYADIPYKNLVPVNNFSMALFALPTRIVHDRSLRLSVTEQIVQESARSEQPKMNKILTSIGGSLIVPFFKSSSNIARSSLCMSNLPGPSEHFTLFGGQCVTKVLLFPPMKFRTAINLGLFSYCGNVNITLAVDGTVTSKYPKFPQLFLKYIEKELDDLLKDTLQSSSDSRGQSEESFIIDCDTNNNNNNNDDKIHETTVGTIII